MIQFSNSQRREPILSKTKPQSKEQRSLAASSICDYNSHYSIVADMQLKLKYRVAPVGLFSRPRNPLNPLHPPGCFYKRISKEEIRGWSSAQPAQPFQKECFPCPHSICKLFLSEYQKVQLPFPAVKIAFTGSLTL